MSTYAAIRRQIVQALGGKCAHCPVTDFRVLEIDHVYGDGCEERRAHGNGRTYLKHILAQSHEGRYQLLCANCHKIKGFERMENRHFNLDAVYHLETFLPDL